MLTKSDLSQIRKVVREEVTTEVKDSARTLDSQIRMSRMHIQQDISELDDRMKNVEIRLDSVESEVKNTGKDIKGIEKNLRYVTKTVNIITKNYDEGDAKLERRVRRIEEHLVLPNEN